MNPQRERTLLHADSFDAVHSRAMLMIAGRSIHMGLSADAEDIKASPAGTQTDTAQRDWAARVPAFDREAFAWAL